MPVPLVNRSTGEVVELPEAEAVQAYKSGKFVFKKGQQIPVVNQAGAVGTIDAADASHAFDSGVRLAAPEEVAQAQTSAADAAKKQEQIDKYGGELGGGRTIGDAFQPKAFLRRQVAGLEAGARGLTMGLSDKLATSVGELVGGDEGRTAVAEHLAGVKAANPVTSMGGEVGGVVAPLLLSGGAAGAAKAAVGGLPGAVAEGGALVERGVMGALGGGEAAGAIGRVAAKALGKAAGGALEGAAYGAGQAVSESALGNDPELTAEKVVAGATHGALIGGLAAGALGGAGAAAGEVRDATGRFVRNAAASVAELAKKTFGVAAPGIGEAVANQEPGLLAKASSVVSGQDAGEIQNLINRRGELAEAPAVRAQAARDVREQLDQLMSSAEQITPEAKGQLKAEYVRKAVTTGNEEVTGTQTWERMKKLSGDIEEMTAAPKTYGNGRILANTKEYLEGANARILDAIKKGGTEQNAKLFVELDQAKRFVGRYVSGLDRTLRNTADPLALLKGRETADRLRGIYDGLREHLEDVSVWGKAAEDQKLINAAWSKQIDAHKMFDARLTTNVGRDPNNPWVQIRRVDPAKADAYVGSLTNPNNDLVHTSIRNYVDSTRDLATSIGQAYDMPAVKAFHVENVMKHADAFGKTIANAEDKLALVNQFKAMKASESGTGGAEVGAVLGALGHPVAGAVGGIVGSLAKPASAIERLTAIERLISKVDLRIGSSVRGFFKEAPVVAGASSVGVKDAVRAGGRVVKHNIVSVEAAEPKAFEAKVREVQQLASNPERAVAQTAASLDGLHEAAPRTSVAISTTALRGVNFLSTKIPAGMTDTNSIQPHLAPLMVSDTERARFARYVTAVNDPTTVLSDLQHGRVTPEQVEALQAVYPKLYEQVRGQVIEQVVSAKSPLPYGKRVQLGILFDAPTDATLDPAFLAAISAPAPPPPDAVGGGPEPKGPPGKPMNIANQFQTTFEAAAAGHGDHQ